MDTKIARGRKSSIIKFDEESDNEENNSRTDDPFEKLIKQNN
jgi:hypothetical protein